MRVLMFGWEFPPHISGGLGTACYGLTQALIQENVDVTFVVPKLYGNEPHNGSTLINASDVPLDDRASVTTQQSKVVVHSEEKKTVSGINTVEVPSQLSGYNLAHREAPEYDIQHWNYEHRESTQTERTYVDKIESPSGKTSYNFQGGYGERLVEEVYHYARVASELATAHTFDVIHAHDWMTFPAAIAAKKISGKPLVIHIHATEHDRAGNHGSEYVYRIEKEAMLHADRIVAVSRWTKDLLVRHYAVRASTIDVVHNGIIPEANLQHVLAHPLGHQVVTFLGRITFQKGPEYFVEAAKKVADRFPEAHFIMAGSGDFLPQIITRVAQLNLSMRFHFTGFLRKPEIDKILSYTRVYVMPSVSEPFGITPLEAIQAGVPVIISKQSGVSEVMKHALKVDFWDTDALSQAICSVLQYKSLSDTLRLQGAEEITTVTWEKAAKKLNTIYHELTT